jgi:hypothetical protein
MAAEKGIGTAYMIVDCKELPCGDVGKPGGSGGGGYNAVYGFYPVVMVSR